MKFGNRLRQIRAAKGLSQRELAAKVGINFTYLSKIENDRLDFSQSPSEATICKLAQALEIDEEELLLLAEKVPQSIRKRIVERPDVFRRIASLNDRALDDVMVYLAGKAHGSGDGGYRRRERKH